MAYICDVNPRLAPEEVQFFSGRQPFLKPDLTTATYQLGVTINLTPMPGPHPQGGCCMTAIQNTFNCTPEQTAYVISRIEMENGCKYDVHGDVASLNDLLKLFSDMDLGVTLEYFMPPYQSEQVYGDGAYRFRLSYLGNIEVHGFLYRVEDSIVTTDRARLITELVSKEATLHVIAMNVFPTQFFYPLRVDSWTRYMHILGVPHEHIEEYCFRETFYTRSYYAEGYHAFLRERRISLMWLHLLTLALPIHHYDEKMGLQYVHDQRANPHDFGLVVTCINELRAFYAYAYSQKTQLPLYTINQRIDGLAQMTKEGKAFLKKAARELSTYIVPTYSVTVDDVIQGRKPYVVTFDDRPVSVLIAGYYARIRASRLDRFPLRAVTPDVHITLYKYVEKKPKECWYYDLAPDVVKPHPCDAADWTVINALPLVCNRYCVDLGAHRTVKPNYQNLILILRRHGVHARHLDPDEYLIKFCAKPPRYRHALRKGTPDDPTITMGMIKKCIENLKIEGDTVWPAKGRVIYHNPYICIAYVQMDIKDFEECVYTLPFVAKKHNQYQRGKIITEKFRAYGVCMSCDYTQFDGTIDQDALDEQFRVIETFLGYKCKWFPRGRKVKYMMNTKVECDGKRDSGEALTAVGNVIIVIGTLLSSPLIYDMFTRQELDFYDDGDDNLVFCRERDVDKVREELIRVSNANHFLLKIDNVATELEGIVFCKSHLARLTDGTWMLLRDVVPSVCKMFYSFHCPATPYFRDYMTTVLECYDHVFGDIEVFLEFKKLVIEKYGQGKYSKQAYNEIKGRYYIDNTVKIPHFEYFYCDPIEYQALLMGIKYARRTCDGPIEYEFNPFVSITQDPYEGKGTAMTEEQRLQAISVADEIVTL